MTPMFRYFLGFQVPADRAGWETAFSAERALPDEEAERPG